MTPQNILVMLSTFTYTKGKVWSGLVIAYECFWGKLVDFKVDDCCLEKPQSRGWAPGGTNTVISGL